MPRYDDRSGPTRLYVGRLSTRTRSRDLEDLFSKYGRVRDVDVKHDFAFIEFYDPRDADDARHYLNGRDFDGNRIIVEFARRGPGGVGREYLGRGPAPGTGRCYNCGHDGHWARDCKAGDWKNKCYRCGERGHIERNCHASPRSSSRYDRSPRHRSRSRSYSPLHSRSRSPDRRRSPPRSLSRSRSYSRSPPRGNHSPAQDHQKSKSRSFSRTPPRQDSRSRSQSPLHNIRSRSGSPAGRASRSPSHSPVHIATNGIPDRPARSPSQSVH